MADSAIFAKVCEALEKATDLTALEARGTVRIALKAAGLEARTVDAEQMRVVLERILPGELSQRGVEDAGSVCATIGPQLAGVSDATSGSGAEAVFARLGD